jgi:transketolase
MIGFGSPNKGGTHDVHGAPLGAAEIANTRRQLDWPFARFRDPGRRSRRLGRACAG